MSNYPNVAAQAGDQYLAMLAQGQDQFIEFVRSSRELMPKLPAGVGAPAATMPIAIPSAREFANAQYEFTTKLLRQQQDFMKRLYRPSETAAPKRSAASKPSRSTTTRQRTKARRTSGKTAAKR